MTEELCANIVATVRSLRLGDPDDLAAMAAFLLSDDASYINGESILIDGGANFT
jgi:NAD(P)-dependent dehydrogenase (short-subunit alcohol dehydrogenase family)